MIKRVRFDELFQINSDSSISPKKRITIGGITMGPGVTFSRGVSFSGIDLTLYIGRDFQVDEKADTTEIIGVYN
ncbi:MAG: hypothetical protein A2033_12940 [Bacteroidetes bacterium GWA2_31_9]|nr:MAG: hypothetical protein A2033_12940 [Bacteroidetes bacterium GWA2_31_9]